MPLEKCVQPSFEHRLLSIVNETQKTLEYLDDQLAFRFCILVGIETHAAVALHRPDALDISLGVKGVLEALFSELVEVKFVKDFDSFYEFRFGVFELFMKLVLGRPGLNLGSLELFGLQEDDLAIVEILKRLNLG